MLIPVSTILLRQILVADQQEVFGIPLFGRLGEIEAAGDHDLAVDHHDLVVGDGMGAVDQDRDSDIIEEICTAVLVGAIAFIQDCMDLYAALMSFQERLCDGSRGETVGLNKDGAARTFDFLDNHIRAVPAG